MTGKRKQAVADKKELILDAAEQIMREEGYAAVTSRRVSERVGSKSTPIHYHFGSMDDLFLALYRRSEDKYLSRLMEALSSGSPVRALWALDQDPVETGLVGEYLALANHRARVREEVGRSGARTRTIGSGIVVSATQGKDIDLGRVSPTVLAFILEAICRTLVSDRGLGISGSHAEIIAFAEGILARMDSSDLQNDASSASAPTTVKAKDD